METAKVQDEKNLVRDMSSNAILSVDREAQTLYRATRRAIRAEKEKFEALEQRLEVIEKMLLKITK